MAIVDGSSPILRQGGHDGHVSRQLRLAYLAPTVLKRLVYGREGPPVTVLDLGACAARPWAKQAGVVFDAEGQRLMCRAEGGPSRSFGPPVRTASHLPQATTAKKGLGVRLW